MYEKENELLDALYAYKNPDAEQIGALLSQPLNFAYVLGRLIYAGMEELAWKTICDCQLQSLLNRELRNVLKLLSE